MRKVVACNKAKSVSTDWVELRRCFEHLADWVQAMPAAPAPVLTPAQPLTTAQKHALCNKWGDKAGTRTLFELIEMVEQAHGVVGDATGQEGGKS